MTYVIGVLNQDNEMEFVMNDERSGDPSLGKSLHFANKFYSRNSAEEYVRYAKKAFDYRPRSNYKMNTFGIYEIGFTMVDRIY